MLGLPARPSLIAYNGYTAGLGNRVRVVLGAKSLAAREGRAFYYVWPTGKQFGPTMGQLWDVREGGRTTSRATSRLLAKHWHYVDETLTWLDDAKRRERIWQLRTGSEIRLPADARPWADELRELTPVPEISDRVNRIFDADLKGRPYVGVMIRAHAVAHAKTRDTSPVEWFVRRMHEIRDAEPGIGFFLSCDTPAVQAQVIDQVPGCVGLEDKGAYNSVEGVRSALADIYLLASSQRLLGPHFSSFVELAQHLSGGRLELETPVDPMPGQSVDLGSAVLVSDPTRPWLR